jgi:hypothetical protein
MKIRPWLAENHGFIEPKALPCDENSQVERHAGILGT